MISLTEILIQRYTVMDKSTCLCRVPLEIRLFRMYPHKTFIAVAFSAVSRRLCTVSRAVKSAPFPTENLTQSLALSFNVDKSSTKTLDVNKPFTLLDKTKSCPASGLVPARKVGLTVDVTAKAHADINYGVVASGSIVPPKVKDFGIFADFDAQLGGTVDLDVFASISLDSGKIMVFQAGLPGLDFPGILTIGPSFQVTAQATAQAQADVKIAVDLAYNVNGAKIYFPPGHGSSLGTFSPANTRES